MMKLMIREHIGWVRLRYYILRKIYILGGSIDTWEGQEEGVEVRLPYLIQSLEGEFTCKSNCERGGGKLQRKIKYGIFIRFAQM